MKKLIVAIAAAVVSLTAMPEKAQAAPHHHHRIGHSHTYCSGHAACGCRVYTRRVVIGFDCYHRPVYRYFSVPIVHRCHRYVRPGRYHHHHHAHHRHYHGHHYYGHHGHHGIHGSYTVRTRHGWVTIRR